MCPLPSETAPAVLGLLFVGDVPVTVLPGTQMPAGAAGAQHPSGCPGHPNSLCRVLGLGHWGVHSQRSPPRASAFTGVSLILVPLRCSTSSGTREDPQELNQYPQ